MLPSIWDLFISSGLVLSQIKKDSWLFKMENGL